MKYPITVRIDDVCPTMDLEKFTRCIALLRDYGIKPLLGIVPDCQDDELKVSEVDNFWEYMLQLKNEGYPIAMHGVYHRYVSDKPGLVCGRKMSEFAGLSYEKQYEIIQHGYQIMKSHHLETDTFFAPGHSYDRTTLRALYAVGFRYNSDGRSFHPYMLEGVKNIPASGAYRLHFNRGFLTICLHPNDESNKTLANLRKFVLAKHSKLVVFERMKNTKCHPYLLSRAEEIINIMIDRIIFVILDAKKVI